ncbi:iron complex transport system permease protein [Gracilibacillus orientalis]|uniref:Iron complex transport system permease protein n=1 Tax=Gracilibacillus orientalis TaxID=334253 RepID=A0A1I4KNZ8_9BACI|nr:iron ABC transporter permease [Gracilibacillus orientalis]SFL80276.1 iron complex transport system permease protein [Gracilibacillus orientalis]
MQIIPKKEKQKWIVFIVSILIFIVAFILSISLGQRQIAFSTTLDAIFYYDETVTEHIIVVTSRLTRAVIATVIGTSLAIAGAMMQALTRNPLAAPDIFGINAGAIFFIVLAITLFSVDSLVHYMWIAFIGAAIAALCVYFLGTVGTGGLSPIRVVLSGAAVSALFVSFTQALLVVDEQRIQSILFWLAGSVAGRSMDMLLPILPFILGGGLLSLLLGGSINVFLSGEDVATGLGQKIALLKILIGVVVVLLAGGSVAIGGSIGFIGLIVPHIVRGLVGPDYRWIIPVSAFIGAGLLLLADVVARFLIMPQEVPVGVMTALIGTPFFIYIARRGLS